MSEDRRLIDKLHGARACHRELAPQVIVPEESSRQWLSDADGQEPETNRSQILPGLTSQPGTLGTIFRKSQNRVQDAALPKKLVADRDGQENWSADGLRAPPTKGPVPVDTPLCVSSSRPSALHPMSTPFKRS